MADHLHFYASDGAVFWQPDADRAGTYQTPEAVARLLARWRALPPSFNARLLPQLEAAAAEAYHQKEAA